MPEYLFYQYKSFKIAINYFCPGTRPVCKKLVISVTSERAFLDEGILICVKKLRNLSTLKISPASLKFKTVKEILNLIRFCDDNITPEQLKNFHNYPDIIPKDENNNTDTINLPRKLKNLHIERIAELYGRPNDEDVLDMYLEEDLARRGRLEDIYDKWMDYGQRLDLEREFGGAIDSLDQFYYMRRAYD